jgi:hypothetical protein
MKEQNEHSTGNKEQINFKLSSEERQIISEMASTTGLSLSEYCRIKCLMNEDFFIAQQKQIADLERENKELKVKSSCFKNSIVSDNLNNNIGTHDIVIKLTEKQRFLLERLYGNFSTYYSSIEIKSEVQNDLRYNLLYTLMIIPQLEYINSLDDDGDFSSPFEDKDYEYWSPIINETFAEYKIEHPII